MSDTRRIPPKTWAAFAAVAVLVAALLRMQGVWGGGHRIAPDAEVASAARALPAEAVRVVVGERELARAAAVPGSVRARTEFAVAPRIQATVLEVAVRPGDRVARGQVLVRLDGRETAARVEQARAAVVAAEAERERVERDLGRVETLLAERAATPQQADQARAAARGARAAEVAARRALDEAQVFAGETALASPQPAVVAERRVEPGDLAAPGQPLVTLYLPEALRVEAAVDETLAGALRVGDVVEAVLADGAPGIAATVEEIVPAADPRTRTVLVKAALPAEASAEVRPGAFARLRVPSGRDRVLAVPSAALREAGQLTFATIVRDGRPFTVAVRPGRRFAAPDGPWVEVLAGLHAGEEVVALQAPPRPEERAP